MVNRGKIGNSFEFVVLAGARAKQLLAGSTPRVAVNDHKKTTIAQEEIVAEVVKKVEPGSEPIPEPAPESVDPPVEGQ
jgi:DNA-directed RNA polymerase omega subunit